MALERTDTSIVLAHIAEYDARRLYVPAGYSSMHAYCVDELHMSEGAAFRRIQAARAARDFPALLDALAEGRLHLSAVSLLAPHLTAENVNELITAATHQRKAAIAQMLATRFCVAQPKVVLRPIPPFNPDQITCQLIPGEVEKSEPISSEPVVPQPVAPATTVLHFQLRFTIDQATLDKLKYVQALLSHSIPSGDVARVFERALDVTIRHCERRKFAAAERPRAGRPRSSGHRPANPRHIPAHVRREVWVRDQGRCTFVGGSGHACQAMRRLEFDHVVPVALGGESTVGNVRLRCRAHNQYEAEKAFGAGFMNGKRQRAAAARAAAADAEQVARDTRAVISGLRNLGCRADEARLAAEHAASLPEGTTLEERLRAALQSLRPPRNTSTGKASMPQAAAEEPPMAAGNLTASGAGSMLDPVGILAP